MEEGDGPTGVILATEEVMKIFKETVAFPAESPQKNWSIRGPGGDRSATITTVAKPSLSVTTGELRDANGCERMLDVSVIRSAIVEGTPLVVKMNEEAAS